MRVRVVSAVRGKAKTLQEPSLQAALPIGKAEASGGAQAMYSYVFGQDTWIGLCCSSPSNVGEHERMLTGIVSRQS
jgi:hypothetical protein